MATTKKKIAYISGTRADFGIMTAILEAIRQHPALDLQLYATGVHLTPGFGTTYRMIQKLFSRTKLIRASFQSDDFFGVARFSGQFISKLVSIFSKDRPDFVLLLGDRPEQLCVALVCLYLGIPAGHFRGGEVSSTFDETARHAITKLASLHFPATKEAAKRIEKMGEEKWRIHTVGEASLDVILHQPLPSREAVLKFLGLAAGQKFILLTQHPVSYELADTSQQIRETIKAVKAIGLPVVVTYPHADAGGRKIILEIERERDNSLFKIFPSLEYKLFLALEREAAVWVGNSSGALVESSSFATPVVNIGTRQKGRQRGGNVLDVGYDQDEIIVAIKKSLALSYLAKLKRLKNPWGDGKTGKRVAEIIGNLTIDNKLLNKQIAY
ncbi:MAG: UDP-N-acetyl-D-glucosamine 2-epimerase, UDP-hydrolysing [Candidatus Yanofskybacteria bacterium RIFCSPLOWO2_02_FULL_45_10]|uniref:UDP-N-acetyl-D-glucosamine 2-epimerase, UDP-hydrolysing n=3 Tax=Patescibacteria group TaxID=1783273 RepID=A0A1F8G3C5_9BACT|nr:MAG: UDP-N-acetyl-D-glucosamine 2-epimerase, UDP-hydrolysing [Candidatus Daviesbacteria bacterium GW2011_GWB1_41_5]OGN19560.1 MAG: UDP-N-acetyl-D-glucosamine 2-epimerase, UDP-hydrolysing [Candidatus Yanofskybacteria bacterium RIFCSPHIGHO2_12_FULL_45_19b]OGN32483.1 MAG: UDP-N-acetyl-D-glucosamine 2-epimerase, UDP-hydrolysing [Candidatus Yanofskybacteria bacterium RIFCSPLOWO2_02_FULL_45_10]